MDWWVKCVDLLSHKEQNQVIGKKMDGARDNHVLWNKPDWGINVEFLSYESLFEYICVYVDVEGVEWPRKKTCAVKGRRQKEYDILEWSTIAPSSALAHWSKMNHHRRGFLEP